MQCAVTSTGLLKIDRIGVGVGVILYSNLHKTGVGVHILAPHSSTPTPENPAKYANTAIPYALDQLEKRGVKPPLSIAVAGGAAMLGVSPETSMGTKVVAAAKDALTKAHLNIKLDQTGGREIRSMTLDIETGEMKIM